MRLNRWALGLGIVALLAFNGYKYATMGDSQRGTQVAVNQVAPALGCLHFRVATSSGDTTLVTFGAVANAITGFTTTAACSIAFSQDPALVDLGWVTAAAADTFLAGHPRAGESVIDTTFAYVPAGGSIDMPLRASMLKILGLGTGKCDGTILFNY